MPDFDRAWALGRWDQSDKILEVWEKAARSSRLDCERSESIAPVFSQLTPQSLVLFSYGLEITRATFDQLMTTNAKLMVYLPDGGREIAPREAIKLCSKGVLGFFVARQGLAESLADRLLNFYGDKLLFGKQVWLGRRGRRRPKRAFLASAFDPLGNAFLDATAAALEKRGIHVNDPRMDQSVNITEKVERLIQESDVLIANMRLSEKVYNQNVLLEIGFARGKGVPVVLCRYARDIVALPANLQGSGYLLKYWDEVDLAMKLYWGLEWVEGC